MTLVDTHSHLYCEEFDSDREEVIERAEKAGISLILLPAIDKATYERQERLEASRPLLFKQMMGVHPTSIGDNPDNDLEEAHSLLFAHPDKYVAVGEIGLDLYWDTSRKEQQIYALGKQIEWAREVNKPVSLHIRNAYQEAFTLLEQKSKGPYRGVMHCFSGTMEDAVHAVEMGFVLGIGGVVTFKNSSLAEIVRSVPLTSIVLETDAPYLAPTPYRGKRNESSYLALVAEKVAQLKEKSLDTVARVTTDTARRIFGITCNQVD